MSYIIERNGGAVHEVYSHDGIRNFWSSPNRPLFNIKFVKKYDKEEDARNDLVGKVKPNYLDNLSYNVKPLNELLPYLTRKVQAMSDHPMLVIRRTNRRTKEVDYLSKDTSVSLWKEFSGNFTRKFATRKEAQQTLNNAQINLVRNNYVFDIIPLDDVVNEGDNEDGGNYEHSV